MNENLSKLSRCLTEAGRIVEQLTSGDSADVPSTEARTQTPRQNQNVDPVSSTPSSAILSRRAAMSSVGLAVDRARSMLNRSQLRGACSRLNSRERLRAASTSVPSAPKRVKRGLKNFSNLCLSNFTKKMPMVYP